MANSTTGNGSLASCENRAESRTRFFFWMAAAMLILNLIGFAPSYFLKSLFETPELPLRTHVHGIVFTAWFVVLMTQVSLIARHQKSRHMQLGALAMFLAVSMVILGLVILYYRALEYHSGERSLEGTALVVWANLSFLAGFVTFVGLGFRFRRQAAIHKRLMLLASIAMMPQALGRIGYMPSFQIVDGFLNNVLYGFGGYLLLLSAMLIHDRISEGRFYPVNVWGISALVPANIVAMLISRTDMGKALIEALG
jgi:uncharacterized membrane protein YjfL (UPF0719 family)